MECHRNISEFAKIFKTYTVDGKLLSVKEWPAFKALKGETGLNKEFLIERTDFGENLVCKYEFCSTP